MIKTIIETDPVDDAVVSHVDEVGIPHLVYENAEARVGLKGRQGKKLILPRKPDGTKWAVPVTTGKGKDVIDVDKIPVLGNDKTAIPAVFAAIEAGKKYHEIYRLPANELTGGAASSRLAFVIVQNGKNESKIDDTE